MYIKKEIDYIFDLSSEDYQKLMNFFLEKLQ